MTRHIEYYLTDKWVPLFDHPTQEDIQPHETLHGWLMRTYRANNAHLYRIAGMDDFTVKPNSKTIYLIGSLRNPDVPRVAKILRDAGHEVFDDWFAAGPTADDSWRDYEKNRGRSFKEGLNGLAAKHVFEFDKAHLDRCDIAVLLMPAGKSAHLELGYILGTGKPGVIYVDSPERWDVMYRFATAVVDTDEELLNAVR